MLVNPTNHPMQQRCKQLSITFTHSKLSIISETCMVKWVQNRMQHTVNYLQH